MLLTPTHPITMHSNTTNHNYYAILDSGASDNYITEQAPVRVTTTAHKPIHITIPNGAVLHSTHNSILNLPKLPEKAREAYTIPGLQNHSLLSVNKLCQTCCKVIFNNNEYIVIHSGCEIMQGEKNKINGMWCVPLSDDTTHKISIKPEHHHNANNANQSTSLVEMITFLHQCLFSPAVDTLCKAIDNNQLIGFPTITSALVKKY